MAAIALYAGAFEGIEPAYEQLLQYTSLLFTIPVVCYSAVPFFTSALTSIRSGGGLNMDVPISLALILALALSLWETSLSGHHAYFDAALALTFFLLAGRYLDHRTRAIARSAAEELTALEVPRAWRLTEAGEDQVARFPQVRRVVQRVQLGRECVDLLDGRVCPSVVSRRCCLVCSRACWLAVQGSRGTAAGREEQKRCHDEQELCPHGLHLCRPFPFRPF